MKPWLYQVISGERSGAAAGACRWLLAAAQVPYGIAVWSRNAWYDRVPGAVRHARLPVVSVGNLTVGGTGKTPCVAWLTRFFQSRGRRVAILSRGYHSLADGVNDEARELSQLVPDALQRLQPDRFAAAEAVFHEDSADLVILDDGFQHRRLHRDLDIVLVDATRPDGFGHLLPRGLLREPISSIRRADVIILTRSHAVPPSTRDDLRRRLLARARQALWAEAADQPTHLMDGQGQTHELAVFQDQPVAAFCGIGNPAGFRNSLRQAGMRVARFLSFPDHHHYSAADVERLVKWSIRPPHVAALVCTRKDLVKLDALAAAGPVPLLALAVDLRVTVGWADLAARLAAVA